MTLPSLNVKQWLGITLMVLVVGVGTHFATKSFFPRIQTVEVGQEQVDENTWVKRTQYIKQRDLNQKLESENQELSKQVNRLDEEVTNLTNIRSFLNTQIDSLQSQTADTVELEGAVADTTALFKRTFGDGLFEVWSEVIIENNSLSNQLGLNQLRPAEIDLAITSIEDQRVFVSSPDIDSVKIQSIRTVEPHKFSRAELIIGGTVLGSLITTITILAL